MGEPDQDERTPAVGLFNFAHSYWASASALGSVFRDVTHPDAPVSYLYFHAIELYLKSFLRLNGHSIARLRRHGHSMLRLYRAAEAHGLEEDPECLVVIGAIPENYLPSRYLSTGAYKRPSMAALWQVCHRLHMRIEPVMNEATGISRLRTLPPEEKERLFG